MAGSAGKSLNELTIRRRPSYDTNGFTSGLIQNDKHDKNVLNLRLIHNDKHFIRNLLKFGLIYRYKRHPFGAPVGLVS